MTPELPMFYFISATVCQRLSSERFGVLLFPLSRCCGASTAVAAKKFEPPQGQRPSGHRRRPSRKPQQKLAGIPWHSVCSISHARMGNGRSRAQPLRSWGIERGPFFRQEWSPLIGSRALRGKSLAPHGAKCGLHLLEKTAILSMAPHGHIISRRMFPFGNIALR